MGCRGQPIGNERIVTAEPCLVPITSLRNAETARKPGESTHICPSLIAAPSGREEMALPLFLKCLGDAFGLKLLLGVHRLQPCVFILELLEPLHARGVNATVLGKIIARSGFLIPWMQHGFRIGAPPLDSL